MFRPNMTTVHVFRRKTNKKNLLHAEKGHTRLLGVGGVLFTVANCDIKQFDKVERFGCNQLHKSLRQSTVEFRDGARSEAEAPII